MSDDQEDIVEIIKDLANKDKRPRDAIVNDFNKKLFRIVNICIERRPKDSNLDRLKQLALLARGYSEEILIKEAGPYLFKYRQSIFDKNPALLDRNVINTEFDKRNAQEQHRRFVLEIFEAAVSEYEGMNDKERNYIVNTISRMLEDYLLFLHMESL